MNALKTTGQWGYIMFLYCKYLAYTGQKEHHDLSLDLLADWLWRDNFADADKLYDMAEQFKLLVSICGRESREPIRFKPDGQRFDQANTVKMNIDTDYDAIFTFKPGRHIDKLMINGELHKLECARTGAQTEGDPSRSFTTLFSTQGFDLTQSGKRKELLMVFELENGVYIKLALQCKLYRTGDTSHAHWGQKLTVIDIDCQLEPGHNYATILKEKYL